MKKNKIIGLVVAAAGVVASISAASALYINKAAQDTGFGIGAKWQGLEGTITYKVNGETSGTVTPSYLKGDGTNGGEGFGGEYTQAHYAFPLSASFTTDIPTQLFVVGNFQVDITNIAPTLQNHAKIWVGVDGYNDNTYGKSAYALCFMGSDTPLTGATYSIDKDIAVSAVQAQTVNIYVKLDEAIAASAMMDLAEGKAFDISVSWGAPKNFEFAYVTGDKVMWQDDGAYAMVPNVNKEGTAFEWIYSNLPGTMKKAKCHKGNTWSTGDDVSLDSTKTYDVYWTEGGENTFVAQS